MASNPLEDRAAERLSGVVYPGEGTDSPGVSDRQRFCVHRVQNDQHVIIDTARPFDESVLIDTYFNAPTSRLTVSRTGQRL